MNEDGLEEVQSVIEKVRKRPVELVLGGVGVVMLGLGVVSWQQSRIPEDAVEIIEVQEEVSEEAKDLVVDVAGAVNNPGVYQVSAGSRLGEAIDKAGGFAGTADWGYVARGMNLAAKIQDGAKVYVPFEGEEAETDLMESVGTVAGSSVVNANTASEAELDALWGIGEARAKTIVENRPYSSVEDLRDKAQIPANVIEQNQGKLVVE